MGGYGVLKIEALTVRSNYVKHKPSLLKWVVDKGGDKRKAITVISTLVNHTCQVGKHYL